MAHSEIIGKKGQAQELQEGNWKFVGKTLEAAIQAKNNGKTASEILMDLDKNKRTLAQTEDGETKALKYLQTAMDAYKKGKDGTTLITYSQGANEIQKGLERKSKEQGQAAQGFVAKTKESAPAEKKKDEPTVSKNLLEDVGTAENPGIWQAKFAQLAKEFEDGDVSAKLIIGVASVFKMMAEDPLNAGSLAGNLSKYFETSRSSLLKASNDPSLSEGEKKAFAEALKKFEDVFGLSLEVSAEKFSNALAGMQHYVAVYDNAAPYAFDNWAKLKPLLEQADEARKAGKAVPEGKALGLEGYSRLYYDTRNSLLSETATANAPYSNFEMYKLISRKYMGGKIVPDGKEGMREIFLIEANEAFMNSQAKVWVLPLNESDNKGRKKEMTFFEQREEFKERFKSPYVLSMNIRSQYDLFMKSRPVMENFGMAFDETVVAELDSYIARLEPNRKLSAAENFVSQIGTARVSLPFNLDTFLKAVESGGMNQTTIEINLPGGFSYTLENASIKVTSDEFGKIITLTPINGGSMSIGVPTELGVPNKCTLQLVSGEIREFNLGDAGVNLTYLVTASANTVAESDLLKQLNLQLAGSDTQDAAYLQIMLDAKLDGFFEHIMPKLCRFSLEERQALFGRIFAALYSIEGDYNFKDQLSDVAIPDVSAARGALRDYIKACDLLLGVDRAKYVAVSNFRMPNQALDNMTIADRLQQSLYPIYNELNTAGVISIPFLAPNLQGIPSLNSGSGLRRRTLVPGSVPSHLSLSRYQGMSALPIQPQVSIPIDKTGSDDVSMISEQLAEAIPGFLHKSSPDLYFRSADFYYTGAISKNELGSSLNQSLGITEVRGKNAYYSVGARHSIVNVGSASITAKAVNTLGPIAVLEANTLVTEWVMERLEAYLLANPTANQMIAAYALKDSKTGNFALHTAYISRVSRDKESEASDQGGSMGNFKVEVFTQKLNRDQLAKTFAGFDLKNPNFGTLARVAWQTDLKGGKSSSPMDLAKRISMGDLTGFVLAATVTENVGLAFLKDQKSAKDAVNINRPGLSHPTGGRPLWRDYGERSAIGAYFSKPGSEIGVFGDVMVDKKEGESYLSQVHGRFVWNDFFSAEASKNKTSAADKNSYMVETRWKLGGYKAMGSLVSSDRAQLLLGPFSQLENNGAPVMGIAGGRFAMTNAQMNNLVFKYSFLRATKGKLWQEGSSPIMNSLYQTPDAGELAHSISGYLGNSLFPALNSSLAGIEEVNRQSGGRGGLAFIFKNLSFNPTQIQVQGLRDYNGLSMAGANVTNIVLNNAGTQIMSVGLAGGSLQPTSRTLYDVGSNKTTFGNEDGRKRIVAGGIRTQGLPFRDVLLGLDVANTGGPSSWEFTGIGTLNNPTSSLFNSMVFSSQKDRDRFNRWFVENTFGGSLEKMGFGLGNGALFAFYDSQKMTLALQKTATLSELRQATWGGGAWVLDSGGWMNFKAGITSRLLENKAIDFRQTNTTGSLEMGYFRQTSEKDKPAIFSWIPDDIASWRLNLGLTEQQTMSAGKLRSQSDFFWNMTVSVRIK